MGLVWCHTPRPTCCLLKELSNFVGFISNHASTLKNLDYEIYSDLEPQIDWTPIPQELQLDSYKIKSFCGIIIEHIRKWHHLN